MEGETTKLPEKGDEIHSAHLNENNDDKLTVFSDKDKDGEGI